MKTVFYRFVIFSFALLGLGSCTKTIDIQLPEFIDPANSSQLSKVLIMPSGAVIKDGGSPASSGGTQAPTVVSNITTVISSNGGTVPLSFTYQNVTGNLGGCYVQVEGADTFYNLPYTATSGATGRLSVPIGLPTNVIEGRFYVIFSVYDTSGRISNRQRVLITVLRLGTGAIQISLSWDTATDQDLWVTDPSGTLIYYGNKTSRNTGGALDRDDVDGYGPENIFWENAPDGKYTVQVNDYSGRSIVNNYYVTINTPSKTKTFTGTTSYGSTANIVVFNKKGNTYDF
jgi:hypothetical protein